MIGKTNGKRVAGAVSGEKYYIATTYPAGSTCTCTNGIYTFTAEDTSGVYVYTVPSTGDWIVSSTNGVFSKNKTISISNMYNCEIMYTYDWNAQGTEGWAIGNKCENTQSYAVAEVVLQATEDNYLLAASGGYAGWRQGTVYLKDPIDFTAFNTFEIDYIYNTPAKYYLYPSIWSVEPNDGTSMAANRVFSYEDSPPTTSGGTFNRHYVWDVSGLTGSHWFGFDIETSGNVTSRVTVKRIHIE